MFLIPWLGAQIFYAKQFFPISFGMQQKSEFCAWYIAFYEDYQKLDQILPVDSVLLVRDFRLSSVYSPRPIFMDPTDLPKGKEVYFFGEYSDTVNQGEIFPGYKAHELVYINPEAVFATYRTPGRPQSIGPLYTAKVIKN